MQYNTRKFFLSLSLSMEAEGNQQQNANNIQPPGSPRRRKVPIDLDAALYIQSQAACVQEPNSQAINRSVSSSTSTVNTIGCTISNSNSNHNLSQAAGFKPLSPSSSTATPSNLIRAQRFDFENPNKTDTNNIRTISIPSNKQYSANYYQYPTGISVDYIDCVSNDDLIPNSVNNMRGIPHCRKHLKFHRNRIEPTAGASTKQQDPQGSEKAQDGSAKSLNEQANGSSEEFPQTTEDQSSVQRDSAVLYPISVSDVRKRTYFIDSLHQDSLLGPDELHRYFPNGRVSIFVLTWNQNRKKAPMNLCDLLLPDQLVNMPDIYAIGIQEAFNSQNYMREWEIEIQTTLGPNHVLLHSCSLGVLHLGLFVRRDLIWFCSTPEESIYNSRSMPTNMIKTKGAVSIAFRFFGTSFMFTNCHFPAHENRLKDRIEEYQRIIKSIDLPKNLKLLKPRYLSNDSTARFDCVFFMGDLNFRLEQRTFDETIQILDDIFQQKDQSYEALTQNDELTKVMEFGQAFHGFDEGQIKFPPTYKFLAQTNKYDKQSKRVPSYTDRILFRSKRPRHIQCLAYDWLPQLLSSDHKPVYCLFSVLVRPGSQMNMVKTLNAGLFQRTIYIEALKRSSDNPDTMLDKDSGGNVICSIS